jgi:hypothetical protein
MDLSARWPPNQVRIPAGLDGDFKTLLLIQRYLKKVSYRKNKSWKIIGGNL